ncbi:alpha/beta hydrolase [Herbiconiux sp. KACC 21604]|uniref:alpha/beta hydrolase n=1 Tax=unclassified Herbiconiux TaxID=2618217 RepID=UPI001C101607|nr:alpha/beta hydrolase [Herbiconiux sp. SALV-R1]WPO85887.1 alpha/beta hydrolase [Herbiconiux sp. KACC 21604]
MTKPDAFSGRMVAPDAAPLLEAFRDDGGRPYHEYTVDQVRDRYETSCAANGLAPEKVHRVDDYAVGDFEVRVYDPRDAGDVPAPVILFLHGGGWVMGSLSSHDRLVRRLSTATGLPAVAVDYRLAPEHPYPAAIEDCRDALRWLGDPDAGHGLAVDSIVLAGDSAGGQLAAVLAIESARDPQRVPISAQVLIHPVTDLAGEGSSYERITAGFPFVADTMRWFAGLYVPAEVDREAGDLSPLRAELPEGMAPAYVLTVDNDPLADEGAAYAAALARAGTTVHYDHLGGYSHGIMTSAGRIPTAERKLMEAAAFIREHARPIR